MGRININWRILRNADVLIYSHIGASYIKECLDRKWTSGIIDAKTRIVYIHPFVIIWTVYAYWKKKTSVNHRYWKRANFRILQEYALIKISKAKVVATFVDNSYRFNVLSRLFQESGIRFYGIQNGIRGPEVSLAPDNYLLTNYFCFGNEVKDLYEKSHCQVDNYFIVGSLKDGIYRRRQEIAVPQKYDICFLSQFREARFEHGSSREMPGLRENTILLLDYIQRFCRENNLSWCIAGSCKPQELAKEYRWFLRRLSRKDVAFIPNDEVTFSTYQAIDSSRLTITISSTAGIEGLGRRNKVLFTNLTKDQYYDLPQGYNNGVWALNNGFQEFETFRNRLVTLLEMPDTIWWTKVKAYAHYAIHADPNEYPQDIIAREISRTLWV